MDHPRGMRRSEIAQRFGVHHSIVGGILQSGAVLLGRMGRGRRAFQPHPRQTHRRPEKGC
ncbi:hypothetical protein SAMN05920897_107143 [Alkalispirochaeta americana]|uniref:Helix-turn-helix domain-containing protein n=1 Tax=Alkalispirochaeta americana TaxID=159291 RepID=A0A1N6S5I7_9SPIO|nr:hypothetical protein [Alkalispirochaeta americana]SIQ36232.1 hypothetical protein SAMN05920897_107143 [Alkalispirochaeta americana]